MFTRTDATGHITTAIEAGGAATADEFDMDTIIDSLYGIAGCWDFSSLDDDCVWEVIEANALPDDDVEVTTGF